MTKLKIAVGAVLMSTLVGCSSTADIVSENISKEAEEFRVIRRVVAINTITGEYLLELTGNCSFETDIEKQRLDLTCLVGENDYRRHSVGLSPTVTYVAEQLEYQEVNRYQYKLFFKPTSVLPTIEG